jgi:hypothetical protein
MGKIVHDDVLDGMLNVLKNNCTRVVVCSTQPTTFTEGNATYALADVTVAATDFTVADDTSGRKVTFGGKSNVLIDASGTAQHIALLDVSNSKLLYVTTCTSQALTANGSNTVTIPTFKISVADPS